MGRRMTTSRGVADAVAAAEKAFEMDDATKEDDVSPSRAAKSHDVSGAFFPPSSLLFGPREAARTDDVGINPIAFW